MSCQGASVGVLLLRAERLLLVKRRRGTPGWACPAGHVEIGEGLAWAAAREVREEVGLHVEPERMGWPVFAEPGLADVCRHGTRRHDWTVFQVVVAGGEPTRNVDETLGVGWYTRDGLGRLAARSDPGLEPVWAYMLTRLRWLT